MTVACPRPHELTRLLDGELTENRAAELRAHLDACTGCAAELDAQRAVVSRISAPIPDLPSPEALGAVVGRLEPSRRGDGRRPATRRATWVAGAAAAAVAALAIAMVLPRGGARDRGEFAARGAPVEWTRKIGVELWALEGPPRRLSPGDRVAPGVPLVGSFSNVDGAPAYLLAFALDAGGDVHWLYPGFVDARSDPASVRLDASVVHRALPDSVVLEDVVPGPLRFVFVVTRQPLSVSSVESVGPTERTPAALRARWPEAQVTDLPVTFGSPPAAR